MNQIAFTSTKKCLKNKFHKTFLLSIDKEEYATMFQLFPTVIFSEN